ncbi:hypothetical protein L211DRAFT_638127 [Terfezia boudieri ATCC MYA-4762]|uniref:Uncharacterized protein n=1 Tax=Terfezia boudieri ATCC MYA-4762 TaxID=1051890 RepID=A0A3N4L900_9PEZI|nr:hypothetical protein L211DRAFT_638127 [Terfezia boudieri ATCC MYA-4762]
MLQFPRLREMQRLGKAPSTTVGALSSLLSESRGGGATVVAYGPGIRESSCCRGWGPRVGRSGLRVRKMYRNPARN